MKIIIDPTDLKRSFTGLAGGQDCFDAASRQDLRRTLEGARVPIVEDCAIGQHGSFYVTKVERIEGGIDVDLFGVCFTNAAGRARLIEGGFLAPTERPHALLGDARADAADRNSTTARRQFVAHMQVNAGAITGGDIPLKRLIGGAGL